MKKTSLKDYLLETLPSEIVNQVNRSFEIVGDIAIIELKEELQKYDKQIGDALLKTNPNIKTILKKSGIHTGEFRTQKMDYVCGENRKETLYLENGIKLKLNVEEVYFSSKLGTERMELSKKIKENSNILVMFSGCGPYTFNILKRQPNINKIDSIEINPIGHKYALENLELNKNLLKKSNEFKSIIEDLKEKKQLIKEKEIIKNLNKEKINFYCGDVRKIIDNELKDQKYDEIFMPLPKDAQLFLDSAFKAANKNCLIHMYNFLHENEFPNLSEDAIKKAAKAANREVEIIETRKVGQYSPRKYRTCSEFIVK